MESTFKYIFALIAGALFLMFFFNLAKNMISSSEKMQASLFAKDFDDYLEISSMMLNGVNILKFSTKASLIYSQGKIRSGKGRASTTKRIVYSPKDLNGNEVRIWSRQWVYPYYIDNLFYISTPDYRYYFVYDSNSKDFVKLLEEDTILTTYFKPQFFNKDTILNKLPTIRQSHKLYKNVRFVLFTDKTFANKLKNSLKMQNADILLITKPEDTSSEDEWDVGKVNYVLENEEEIYIGVPMMLGAIFAEDYNAYKYNLNKALQKFEDITQLYIEKTQFMSDALAITNNCNQYVSFITSLQSYKSLAKSYNSVQEFSTMRDALEKSNRREFGSDCPPVF